MDTSLAPPPEKISAGTSELECMNLFFVQCVVLCKNKHDYDYNPQGVRKFILRGLRKFEKIKTRNV